MGPRKSLVFAIVFFSLPCLSLAGIKEGESIYRAKKCGECHLVSAPSKTETLAPRLKTSGADPALSKKGPDLWYAGNKFEETFFSVWLSNPLPIRPMAYNSLTKKNPADHPILSKKEAEEVAPYLVSLKTAEAGALGLKPGAPRLTPAGAGPAKGRIIFERKFGCYGCHELKRGNTVVGGLSGPSFIEAGKRLKPDWIYAYLKNPLFFNPEASMPVYAGLMTDEEMALLASYVASLQ